MPKHPHLLTLAALLTALLMAVGCSSRPSAGMAVLATADSLMESRPDSALRLLRTVDPSDLRRGEESARYALLMSMALDKNYIDTTTFDILRPAIDYYLRKGTPDERLRTLYYQGVIHLNRQEDEEAMNSFMAACDLRNEITDSIVLARTLVAQATLYNKQYKIHDLISKSLDAARIYDWLGKETSVLRCYAKAINGYVILKDSISSDSLIKKCRSIVKSTGAGEEYLFSSELSYIVKFGSLTKIKSYLDTHKAYIDEDSATIGWKDNAYDFALGYSKIGEYDKAVSIFTDLHPDNTIADSLRFYSIKYDILNRKGDVAEALTAYKKFSAISERYNLALLSDDFLFADHKHQIERENIRKMRDKDNIIRIIIIAGAGIILMLLGWAYYRNQLNKAKHIQAENDIKRIKADRDAKKLEAQTLKLDKNRLEAEQLAKELEAETLKNEKKRIEEERDNLTLLLNKQTELSVPLVKLIKARIDILNGLLVKEITSSDKLPRSVMSQINSFRDDNEVLMSFVRTNILTTRPRFMDYLKNHELTEEEINYACLSAIGMKGSQIGERLKIKRLYEVSGEIRRKLGLDESESNLCNFLLRTFTNMNEE